MEPVRSKNSDLPFYQLANIPKPVIPKIELDIERMDLTSMLQYTTKSSLGLHRKVGYSMQDRCTQTEQSDILDLHYGIEVLQNLMQDAGQLRRDLNYAAVTLKANYEKQIQDHSTQLINDKVKDLETKHEIKMDQLRKSYQVQLDNSIRQIAGQYKAYYNDILQGKTGHHDAIIKKLKEEVAEKDLLLHSQEAQIENLENKLKEFEGGNENPNKILVTASGISQNEADELYEQVTQLESKLDTCKAKLAIQEDENEKLQRKVANLNKKLEDEMDKYKQLEKDMKTFKQKTKMEQEKSTRMAENQLAMLEKQMKEQVEAATRDAALKAQEQADMQRLRDQAKFQEEMDKRKLMEEQLRTEAQQKPGVIGDSKLLTQLEKLQKIEQQQKREILKLKKELERTNKVWELKMAVIKKNFHALKDEFHIRHTLQRQSVQLHHTTVGYASSGNTNVVQESSHSINENKPLLPKLMLKTPPQNSSLLTSHVQSSNQSSNSPLAISTLTIQLSASTKNVHFEETNNSQGRLEVRV